MRANQPLVGSPIERSTGVGVARTGGKTSEREDEREELSRDVLRHAFGVVQAMKSHMAELAAAFGLTTSQLAALWHLDEAVSQRELAGCLHFDASNVTDIVDRLEARGLVGRTLDLHDRRARRVGVTPRGHARRR